MGAEIFSTHFLRNMVMEVMKNTKISRRTILEGKRKEKSKGELNTLTFSLSFKFNYVKK